MRYLQMHVYGKPRILGHDTQYDDTQHKDTQDTNKKTRHPALQHSA
jgi:hypothetical protein